MLQEEEDNSRNGTVGNSGSPPEQGKNILGIFKQKLISVSEGMGDESLARLLQEEEELTRKRTGGRSSGPPPTRTPMLKSKVIFTNCLELLTQI